MVFGLMASSQTLAGFVFVQWCGMSRLLLAGRVPDVHLDNLALLCLPLTSCRSGKRKQHEASLDGCAP